MRARTVLALGSVCLTLAACGGGGGGGDGPRPPAASIAFSADQLSFSTTGPWDFGATPTSVRLTATVQGTINGTLNIVVQVNNPELISVSNVLQNGPNSGEATVTPASPVNLSIGRHTGSIVVRACVDDTLCNANNLQGSPKTINVTYDIPTNVEADAVMPHVVTANVGANVALRGSGFTANATVSAGGIEAMFPVGFVSSSEIRAILPRVDAGTHSVLINSGAVPFAGTIVAVPAMDFDPVFLPHATPGLTFVRSIEYDAERQALLIALAPEGEETRITRYSYSGGSWASPTFVTVPGLQQVRMAPDGSRVLALRSSTIPSVETAIEERDPVTLDLQRSSALRVGLLGGGMAFTNDSQALVRMAVPGSGSATQYVFGLNSRQFRALPFTSSPFGVVASGDGGRGVFVGGEWLYDAATGKVRQTFSGNGFGFLGNEPASDRNGSHIQTGVAVLNEQLTLIGTVPSPSVNGDFGTATINREGTRMYSAVPVEIGLPKLYTWDISAPASLGTFAQIGSAVEMPGDPGLRSSPAPEMTIAPDGGTVFIGGFLGIVVMPAPSPQ
jgi:hypothetical protein